MGTVVDVNVGEVEIAGGSIVLRAIALGSCIGAAAFANRHRIGALAHIMLPGAAPDKAAHRNKYAVNAIANIVKSFEAIGAELTEIEFCLVGAGNVLENVNDTICSSNINSVLATLDEYGIGVRASLLGGTLRKSVSLDVGSGLVLCSEGGGKERQLWWWR